MNKRDKNKRKVIKKEIPTKFLTIKKQAHEFLIKKYEPNFQFHLIDKINSVLRDRRSSALI